MKKDLQQQVTHMKQSKKHRKGWQAFVRMLALCVVFCTTYVLVLPAITMQREPICGVAEHTHSEECWSQSSAELRGCGIPEGVVILHQHNELCRNEAGELICTLAEKSLHTHDESCYTRTETLNCPAVHVHSEACTRVETVLFCMLEETEGHTHSESCTGTRTVQVCTLEEHDHGEGCFEDEMQVCTLEVHSHGEGCFVEETVECQIPETEGHMHSEGCYSQVSIPCTVEIPADHVHDSGCYEVQETLTCGLEEITEAMAVEHIHTESCLVTTEPVLLCGLEEHIHEDACYPQEETPAVDEKYLCASAAHTHTEGCYDETGALTCSIPEHTHEAACLVAELDLTADVESEKDWMRSVSAMTRTGNWPADVLAVAQTQLGYEESTKNMILDGEELKGYTRYGAWYGAPYGDWCAMYASFCLRYAGVEDFPLEANVDRWIDVLTENGIYAESLAYTGKPGDLIFFDYDQTADGGITVDADHVGIVAELIPANGGETAKIRTIEGNKRDKVTYATYELDDPAIIGYGLIPFGEQFRLTHEGGDYTVTVTVGSEAGIPDTAELSVREIEPGTDEYNTYYEQSLAALSAEEVPQISFARFFDISFLVDGVETEPAAPVDIEIVYSDAIAVQAEESGSVVHFAKDGVEVLNPETSLTESGDMEGVDTFRFTQDSFSVTGTLIGTQAAVTSAIRVNPWEIDNTGNTMYVLVAQVNGQYYALSGAVDSYPVAVTVNGNSVTLPSDGTEYLFWTFVDKPNDNTDYLYNPVTNVGSGRYLHPFNNGANNQNITTGNPYDAALVVSGDTFKIRGANNNFVRFANNWDKAGLTTDQNQATSFFPAAVGGGGQNYNVWFDGTLGGMMSYYGAANTNIPAAVGADGTAVVELPETWQTSPKYDYVIRGWYDINTQTYYSVDPDDNIQPTATVRGNTVFYADWIAATYDVGQDNDHAVDSLDTNDFITTHVFDYNVLFNVLSQYHTGTITAASHSETWNIYNNGETVPYGGGRSLGFAFVDYDAGGDFSYANDRDNTNINQSGITYGILQEVTQNSGQDLLELLFDPERQVIGKYYAGTGNYLFQYMDSTTENYDGEHDGYYYLDSRLNAASYNQSEGRFYLYDYLERTSDSRKDGGAGQYSDLLPFNSPYIFEAHQLDEYTDSIRRPGYEYDAKDGASGYQEYNSPDDATTNYFFGLRTDIEFFLPNDTATQDEYGNYGNISTRGEHMVFDFHGDDDVWVFVDGELLLDIGGLHGIMHGRIDFSTGTISYGADGAENTSSFHMGEGTHTMTVYYMERGSSQSNCAIYFNIAPRYDLEITKEDIYTADKLDGAVFSIYDDEAMTIPSQLWTSEEAYHQDMQDGNADNTTNSFTVVDGVASCWGISAGKTYYIVETTPPPGYPLSNDLIRITLNNRGTATIETTTLHGPDGEATEGFAVIKQNVNDTLKIVALTVTNQQDMETTEVRVKKTWADGSTDIPASITVYLTADGVRVGRTATLTAANGWSYTWKGLPKYSDDEATQEIIYAVEEILVPNYITTQTGTEKVVDHVDWIRTAQMSDSETYLLVHNGQALTYNGSSFGWMDVESAKLDSGTQAQWKVTTDHDGFHLKNGAGYTLTYNTGGYFYGTTSDAVNLNQVIYYLNSRLVVHDHDVYYQFGANGAAVREDGLAFTLYQKEAFTGFLVGIENVPVQEDKQTYVEVTKVWDDGADRHVGDSVTIRLLADGKDTGRYVILDASNNWSGGFYDLPYYQVDGTTPIVYTVVEDEFPGYAVSYSGPTTLPGEALILWPAADSLSVGNTYRFLSGSYALTVLSDGTVTTAAGDLSDTRQQWTVEDVYGLRLKNLATGQYLARSGTWLYMTGNVWEAAVVTMDAGRVKLGDMFLELGSGYATATSNGANVTGQTITQRTETNAMPGTGYTVTNAVSFTLPNTGGMGTDPLTFGGAALLTASAMMYCCINGRKRRKGGDSNE